MTHSSFDLHNFSFEKVVLQNNKHNFKKAFFFLIGSNFTLSEVSVYRYHKAGPNMHPLPEREKTAASFSLLENRQLQSHRSSNSQNLPLP